MVGELAVRHALPKEIVDGVTERTGGVPLFVEEVTRLLLERGEQGGIQAIPPTLQQSLTARLDRLGPAREVAQIGAVIGRDYSYALVHAVAGMDDTPLQAALDRLVDADILLVQGLPPDADYRFKHALIQDAAYENLLKSRRQVMHRRIAETLRDRFAEKAAAEPEVLAHHFTQAGLTDAAIEWWGKAGDQALRRSAFQEAISHLGKAIELADKSEDATQPTTLAPGSVTKRLKLQTSYGQATAQIRGFASDETKAAFAKAQQLLTKIDDPTERFVTYYGLWLTSVSPGDLASARSTAETFWRDAKSASRVTEAAIALTLLGFTCLYQGDFGNALSHLQGAIRIYDPQRDHEAKFRFGLDAGAFSAVNLANAHWLVGEVEKAREVLNDARRRAIDAGHAVALAFHSDFEAMFETLRGDAEAVRQAAQRCINVSREHGLTVYLSEGIGYLGWALVRLGDRKTGIGQLNECISIHSQQGNRLFIPFFQGLLAEIEAEGTGLETASAAIEEAITLAAEMGAHWTDAFLHRIRGEILLKRGPANTGPAEEAFLAAIAIAQQQKAKSFELRAALALAKLYQSTGRAPDAHAVLAPALEGFSPTPEFPEIAQSQTLLAALAETDEVNRATTSRQRRLKLQADYGQALLWSRGFGSEEAKVALDRAQDLAAGTDSAPARFFPPITASG
jgi:predicted ATPase